MTDEQRRLIMECWGALCKYTYPKLPKLHDKHNIELDDKYYAYTNRKLRALERKLCELGVAQTNVFHVPAGTPGRYPWINDGIMIYLVPEQEIITLLFQDPLNFQVKNLCRPKR